MSFQIGRLVRARALGGSLPCRPTTSSESRTLISRFIQPGGVVNGLGGGSRRRSRAPTQNGRLIAFVFLPFAAGYYLSYLFRSINAPISALLTSDLALGAADLGLLTSVYFLTFAAAQIPIGVLEAYMRPPESRVFFAVFSDRTTAFAHGWRG